MNNSGIKVIILFIYILLLSKIMGFEVILILNLPFILMVSAGALLLAFLDYNKEKGLIGFIEKLKTTVFLSGGLTTFLANIALLPGEKGGLTEIYQIAVRNFLPLFYSFIFYFLLGLVKGKANNEEVEVTMTECKGGEYEEDRDKLEDYGLTRQELIISLEILSKLTNNEIADKLSISESTVKKHISHIFQKVGVSNRTEFIHKFK